MAAKDETPADVVNGRKPAFPGMSGMTKREWLAGMAMQGMLAGGWESAEQIASRSVEFADRVLLALTEEHQ